MAFQENFRCTAKAYQVHKEIRVSVLVYVVWLWSSFRVWLVGVIYEYVEARGYKSDGKEDFSITRACGVDGVCGREFN